MSASNPIPPARAWADIDLGALVANARTVLSVSGSRLLPMVKANAYGIGATEATRALEAVEPWGYGVVTVEEGTALRRCGIRRPIIVFGPVTNEGVDACLREDLRPAVGDLESLPIPSPRTFTFRESPPVRWPPRNRASVTSPATTRTSGWARRGSEAAQRAVRAPPAIETFFMPVGRMVTSRCDT